MTRQTFISRILVLLLLAAGMGHVVAQKPSMTYDGKVLKVIVPNGGRLGFVQSDTEKVPAISRAFSWDAGGKCLFMPGEYEFLVPDLEGESGNVCLPCLVNEESYQICVEIARKPIVQEQNSVSNEKKSLSAVNIAILIVLIAILLPLLALLLLRKRKMKGEQQLSIKPSDNVFSMIEDKSSCHEKGLQHVKDRKGEYLTFDLREVFRDTTIEKVYFSTALIKRLYDFFNRSLEGAGRTNETGCYLLGCWDYADVRKQHYDISLEYMVEPGDDADFGEYSLNFGKKIGINMGSVIHNLASKSKRDYVLTCWMHSHPGLGLFLSHQDLVVQQQLVYPGHKGRLLAIVVDTNTPDLETGFFTPRKDGSMNNNEDVMKWFSLEDIYKKAKETVQRLNNPPQDNVAGAEFPADPNYMRVSFDGETIRCLDFSGKAINQMNDVLYAGKRGVAGYFYGDASRPNVLVENCLQYENEEKIGCIIHDESAPVDALCAEFVNEVNGCKFIIIYRSDEQMQVCSPDSKGGFASVGTTAIVSMSQMKEWIRRKRV